MALSKAPFESLRHQSSAPEPYRSRVESWLRSIEDPWSPYSIRGSRYTPESHGKRQLDKHLENITWKVQRKTRAMSADAQDAQKSRTRSGRRAANESPTQAESNEKISTLPVRSKSSTDISLGGGLSSARTSTPDPRSSAPEEESTPRASSSNTSVVSDAVKLPPSQPAFSERSSDEQSSQSGRTQRSQSPAKWGLRFGKDRFIKTSFDSSWDDLPQELRTLYDNLSKIASGYGVVSQEFKEQNKIVLREYMAKNHMLKSKAFYHATAQQAQGTGNPQVCILEDIIEESLYCRKVAATEATWNCLVHTPIMKEARRQYRNVRVTNLTTATISSPHLLPTLRNNAKPNHKVDLGFIIDSEMIQDLIEEVVSADINQTAQASTANEPISVSVETKLPGQSLNIAESQVAVWAFAQYLHLYELFGAMPKFLPLLIVQGHEWRFLAILPPAAPIERASGVNCVIVEDLLLGSTTTMSGVLQVYAALQVLARWSSVDYSSWIETQLKRLKSNLKKG